MVVRTCAAASTCGQSDSDESVCDWVVTLEWTRLVVQKVLIPIFVIMGTVGNLINIAVLTQKTMRYSSTNTYLTALAIFDSLYLIFAFTMSLKHYESMVKSAAYITYRKPFGKPIVDTSSNITVWLTLTFTIERYIGVVHPMKGKKWCTPERAQLITIIVCCAAAVITFPEFFECRVVQETITTVTEPGQNASNTTILRDVYTAMGRRPSYQLGYVYLNQALFTFLPLITLIVFNVLLIRAVLDAARKRKFLTGLLVLRNKKQERQNKEQQKITIMLIGVVIVFIICQLPQAIMNLYITYITLMQDPSTMTMIRIRILNNVFNLLVLLNSTLNFPLYSCFSTRYRTTFKILCCKCIALQWPWGRESPVSFSSTSSATHQYLLRSRRYTVPTLVESKQDLVHVKHPKASLSRSAQFITNHNDSPYGSSLESSLHLK